MQRDVDFWEVQQVSAINTTLDYNCCKSIKSRCDILTTISSKFSNRETRRRPSYAHPHSFIVKTSDKSQNYVSLPITNSPS